MLSFYPGPSKIYPEVKSYMEQAADSGILSVNHRSPKFVEMCQHTVKLLRAKLDIPDAYQVFFLSSATECWEVIAQSYVGLFSLHVFNGAFGEKWFNNRQRIMPNCMAYPFSLHRSPSLNQMANFPQAELVCLTQNETSNATQLTNGWIGKVKKRFPQALVCVDATSSMAGIALDWLRADIWFASVQKCFGLPAGMAIMVCSKRAIERAKALGNDRHYNSIVAMAEKAALFQTTHTPNVLGIFLLGKVMEMRPPIKEVSRHIHKRVAHAVDILQRKGGYTPLVNLSRLRSDTVMAWCASPKKILAIKQAARAGGFELGNGYGKWKETTFRIANFPAITDDEMARLTDFLLADAK